MKNICAISLIVLLALGMSWAAGYRLNVTRSLPVGLYRMTGGPVQRGELAAFCLEDAESISLAQERGYLAAGSCPSGLRPLLKVVFGLAGDVVGIEKGLIAVNGHSLAGTAVVSRDSKGRPAPSSRLVPGVIAPGKVLVLSPHHSGSFDSRYFGLVPLAALRPVEPVLTF